MNIEPVKLKSNEFWGKRSGSYYTDKPKGSTKEWGNIFQQSQWGSGANNSGKSTKKGKGK